MNKSASELVYGMESDQLSPTEECCMSEYSWLGVIVSTFVSTLAAGSYMVMAVPYFDDAPYIQDLKKGS